MVFDTFEVIAPFTFNVLLINTFVVVTEFETTKFEIGWTKFRMFVSSEPSPIKNEDDTMFPEANTFVVVTALEAYMFPVA